MPKVRHAIAEMFAMPHFVPTVRLSTGYTGVPTAVASPFAIQQLNWSSPSANPNNPVPPGQTFAAVSRSPLTAQIQWVTNSAGAIYTYLAQFTQYAASVPIGLGQVDHLAAIGRDRYYVPIQRWDYDSTQPLALHGPQYFPVDIGESKASWFDGNGVSQVDVTFTFMSALAHEIITVTAQLYDGLQWRDVDTYTLAAGWANNTTAVFNLITRGYHRFLLEGPDGTSTDVEYRLEFEGHDSAFSFKPLPQWESMESAVDTIRCSGVSLMITPNAPALYRGGQCAGLQLPNDRSWFYPCEGSDPYSVISSDQNSTTMDFQNGIYGFLKPTDPEDLRLLEPLVTRNETIIGYRNPVNPPGGWLVTSVFVSKVDTSYPGGLAHVTTCFAVEFQTVSPWFEVAPPTVPVSQFEKGLQISTRMPQWHSNSFHIGDILKFIYSGAKKVLGAAPLIANVVSAVAPEASPIANFVGGIAGKIGGLLPDL